MYLPYLVGSMLVWWCLLPVTKVTAHLIIEFLSKRYSYLKLGRHLLAPGRPHSRSRLAIYARLRPLQSKCRAPLQLLEVPPTVTPNVCSSARLLPLQIRYRTRLQRLEVPSIGTPTSADYSLMWLHYPRFSLDGPWHDLGLLGCSCLLRPMAASSG